MQYIKEFINSSDKLTDDKFVENLRIIGHSNEEKDFSEERAKEIIEDIKYQLEKLNCYDKNNYMNLIKANNDYYLIELQDKSTFTLLYGGKQEDRYIHLHPARNSNNIIRTSGNALKTVILMERFSIGLNNLKLINEMRKQYLSLSPINKPEKLKKIKIMYQYFS